MRFILARNAQQTVTFFAGIAAVLLFAVSSFALAPKVYAADDCGPNAIMKCGFSSSADFIKNVRANNDGNGGSDLQRIYSHFGLNKADYDRFVSTAKSGTVYKDGRVVVGGQTVLKDANSIGRTKLDGRHNKSMVIVSTTYYYGATSRVFLSNSIPAKVMFDSAGNAEFVVLTDCGNPVWGTKVPSSAKCDLLKASPVSGQNGKYNFTTQASKTGNAKITKYVYKFDDGKSVTMTSGSTAVPYTFAEGSHKVSVTVFATVPGGTTIETTCETVVTVSSTPKECKPGIPIGDKRCNPCPYDSSLEITDENCKKAEVTETLPNTGAGNFIALTSAALIGGYLFYRQRLFKKRNKEAFEAAEVGASPLPLADPLATDDPLAKTPLEPKQPVRSTLRRRRQF